MCVGCLCEDYLEEVGMKHFAENPRQFFEVLHERVIEFLKSLTSDYKDDFTIEATIEHFFRSVGLGAPTHAMINVILSDNGNG